MTNLKTTIKGTDTVELNKGYDRRLKEDVFQIMLNGIEVAKYPSAYNFLALEKFEKVVKGL